MVREELGLTQEQFSDLIGLSRQTVTQVERNLQEPSFKTIAAYAQHSPLSISWVLLGFDRGEEENMPHSLQVQPDVHLALEGIQEARLLLERAAAALGASEENGPIAVHGGAYRDRRAKSRKKKRTG